MLMTKYNTEASDEEICPCSKLSEHARILFYSVKIFPMTQAMHGCSYWCHPKVTTKLNGSSLGAWLMICPE